MDTADVIPRDLRQLQDQALDILQDITDIFPEDYRFTLIARHHNNNGGMDIVLTDDVMDDAIAALERNKTKMERSQ